MLTPSDHSVVQIEASHRPSDAHPGFFEGLRARMQGAAPIQAGQAATELICSVLEAVAMGTSLGAAATHSLVQVGLHVGLDTAFHVGITAANQTENGQTRFSSESATKEEALDRMQGLSAMLSMAGGAVLSTGLSKAAAALLHEPLSGTAIALGILNSFVATGVITAGAVALYQTNPAFRKKMDAQLESVFGMFKNQPQPSHQSADPPSFAQADAMELGQAGPVRPQHGA
jgi:hypothetical protein